jgi:dolichol-phosphate mannosyltransferase
MISVVIPAKNETLSINKVISNLETTIEFDFEILIVVEDLNDPTIISISDEFKQNPKINIIINEHMSGVAGSIKTGVEKSTGSVIVITMADSSDNVADINNMSKIILSGYDIVVASRYAPGGGSVNAPLLKSLLSRYAGVLLRLLTKVQTTDPTNAFKAYSRKFISRHSIESTSGFTIGLELIGKGVLEGALITEIPTIWTERNSGKSKFKIFKWFSSYVYWFLICIKNRYKHVVG